MRLLFFSPYYLPHLSGLTTFPHTVLKHLSLKHQVTVLTFAHQALPRVEKLDGIIIHRLPYLAKISKGFIAPLSPIDYAKFLKNTDLVLLNLPNAEGLPLAIQANRQHKLIYSLFHCEVQLDPTLQHRIINKVLNWSVARQCALSTRIIGTSMDYLQSVSLLQPYLDKCLAITPPLEPLSVNETALKKFRQNKQDKIWIGFIGRVSHEKGLEYLIQAASQLQLDKPFELIFAGPFREVVGESNYHTKFQQMLTNSHIPYRLLGIVPQQDLGALYRSLDVLVLPSINQTEAFGLVQGEAMVLGTPVVATNLPGIRIPVQATDMGKIVPPGDSVALAAAIKAVVSEAENFSNKHTLQKAHQFFNLKESLAHYGHLFS